MPTLEEYLQMFNVNPEDLKRAQMSGLLGGMGAGLLSAPGMRGVANMGMGGYQGAMDARTGAEQAGYNKLKQRALAQQMASGDMDYQTKQRDFQDENTARDTLANFKMPAPLPSMSPTPQNADALASAPKTGIYEKLIAQAEALESKGLVKQATAYRTMAEKYAPQVHGESTGTDAQGNRVRYVTMKDGSTKVLPVGPDKEKLSFQDAGGKILGLDPFSGSQVSGVGKTMAPGESARLGLDERKFSYQQGRDTAEDAAKAAAGPKVDKPSDTQLAAQGFLERMQKSGAILNDIEGKGYTPSFGQALSRGMGEIPVVGGTAQGLSNMVINAVSPHAQPYSQAQADWVRAKLRKESGAVIGPQEMADEIKTYFPQPGEGAEVIAQKADARKQAERSMAIMGGVQKFADRATDKAPTTEAQYNALPSGAVYTAPDGTQRKKK